MKAAFFSKSLDEKTALVQSFLDKCGKSLVIHVFPKNRAKEKIELPGYRVHRVSYEDLTKKEQWLYINSIIGPDTVLILENPSRYPKISSEKVTLLQKLAMQTEHVAIADIVPFTLSIEYLYTPYSYLGREILGFPHYYAFREGYHEIDEHGKIRSSHDHELLAGKVKAVSTITYPKFLCSARQTIEYSVTDEEQAGYDALREKLFSTEKTPQRIITQLSDFVHAFDSRISTLLNLLKQLNGSTVIYTNLTDYAKRVARKVKEAGLSAIATSYQVGSDEPFNNAIYLESPIVKSYYLLDAESRLPDHCNVFHILGNTKIDRYLYGQMMDEIMQIDGFTQELYRASHPEARTETISANKRVPGREKPTQLDLFKFQESPG